MELDEAKLQTLAHWMQVLCFKLFHCDFVISVTLKIKVAFSLLVGFVALLVHTLLFQGNH